MTNEQIIREACIKTNHEIMELKFGVPVKLKDWPNNDDYVFVFTLHV